MSQTLYSEMRRVKCVPSSRGLRALHLSILHCVSLKHPTSGCFQSVVGQKGGGTDEAELPQVLLLTETHSPCYLSKYSKFCPYL